MATAEWLVVAAAAAAPIALVALGPRFAAPPPARLTIAALHVYPVKSMAPLHLDQLKLDAHGGAELDRRWMVVRATPDDDGAHRFMSQRQLPAMATVVPTLEERVLQLSCGAMAAPLRLPLQPDDDADASVVAKVWGSRMAAQDCGDAAAAWLSACLNAPLRLVRMRRDHCGEGLPRALDETAVAELQRAGGLEADAPQEGLAFVDGHPLLVVCDASLSDLNRRLRAANLSEVPMDRFRPNVVLCNGLRGDDGRAFAEDGWAALASAGGALLLSCGRKSRCRMTGVDQRSGAVDAAGQPLATLRAFRCDAPRDKGAAVWFGQSFVARGPAVLRVGEALAVQRRLPAP